MNQWWLEFMISLEPITTGIYGVTMSQSEYSRKTDEPSPWLLRSWLFNTLRPRQNERYFADIFKCIFLNENVWIPIKMSLKFVPKGPINNIPALVQIMAWRRPGDKPLSELMIVRSKTHICVTRPQWAKSPEVMALNMHDKCVLVF